MNRAQQLANLAKGRATRRRNLALKKGKKPTLYPPATGEGLTLTQKAQIAELVAPPFGLSEAEAEYRVRHAKRNKAMVQSTSKRRSRKTALKPTRIYSDFDPAAGIEQRAREAAAPKQRRMNLHTHATVFQ